MQSQLLMLFHLLVMLASLWVSIDLVSSLSDDFLGLNQATLWLSLIISTISVLVIIALYTKVNKAITYANIFASLYIGIIVISLSIYLY